MAESDINPYKNAIEEELASLHREKLEIEKKMELSKIRLTVLDQKIDLLQGVKDRAEPSHPNPNQQVLPLNIAKPVGQETYMYTGESLATVAERVLQAQKQPMKLHDIATAAAAGGYGRAAGMVMDIEKLKANLASVFSKYINGEGENAQRFYKESAGVFGLGKWLRNEA